MMAQPNPRKYNRGSARQKYQEKHHAPFCAQREKVMQLKVKAGEVYITRIVARNG